MPSQGYTSIGSVAPGTATGTSLGFVSIGAVQPAIATAGLAVTLGSASLVSLGSVAAPAGSSSASSVTLGSATLVATALVAAPPPSFATGSITLGDAVQSGTASETTPGGLAVTLKPATVAGTVEVSSTGFLCLEESIVSALRASSPLTAIVGNRIFEEFSPPTAQLPCLVYTVADTTRTVHLGGTGSNVSATVEISCLGRSSAERKAIEDVVLSVLNNSGVRLGGSLGVYVAETTFEGTTKEVVSLNDGTSKPAKLATMEFTIRHKPPI